MGCRGRWRPHYEGFGGLGHASCKIIGRSALVGGWQGRPQISEEEKGFPAEFYQHYWDVIKSDLLKRLGCLHDGHLDLFRLNFRDIILLPKIINAERIQQCRPIYLLNVSFKIFTKSAILRLNLVADPVVRPTQTTFMRGRNILDGVAILHETVDTCQTYL